MANTYTLTVTADAVDVLDSPLGLGTVGITYAQAQADPKIINQLVQTFPTKRPFVLAQLVILSFAVTVLIVDYEPERATLTFVDGAWRSDNPHIAAIGSNTTLQVTARLGVLRFAPITYISESTTVAADFNPAAVVVEKRDNGYQYRGLWLEALKMYRLGDPIAGDFAATDWKRFNIKPATPVAKEHGCFALLEFGFPLPVQAGRPRFLVGVWYPKDPLGERPDVNVFYSPNAGPPLYPADKYPFTKTYPYQLKTKDHQPPGPGPLSKFDQKYADLAVNYVCTGYKIAYQMLAAAKNSVIIMPIQASGDWGPFARQGTVWRIVLEVLRFGESRRLIAATGVPSNTIVHRLEGTQTQPASSAPPPVAIKPAQVVVTTSSFSAGLEAILEIIGTADADAKLYPPSHFGAPATPLQTAWKAIWDIDGAFRQMGGPTACIPLMRKWWTSKSGRNLRMYHSEDTCDRNNPLIRSLLPECKLSDGKTGAVGFVDQGYSDDTTLLWVLFSNSMLTTRSPADEAAGMWPVFGKQDAHHTVPTIAFGHAWSIVR